MKVDLKEIKNITKDGVNYYSVVDSINKYFSDKGESVWVKLKPKLISEGIPVVQLVEGSKTIDYVKKETAIKVIQDLEPAKLSGFDSLLKGVLAVPKPK